MFKRLTCGFLLLAGGLLSSGCCMSPYGVCNSGVGCDSCGDVGGYQTCGECQPGLCHHPWLWARARNALTCGAGCGDVYRGEWMSDPPACGDPCGSCGEYECGGCGGCWNPLRGLAHLWGYRYAPGGYGHGYGVAYDGECESCADSYDSVVPGEIIEETPAPEKAEEKLPTPKPDAEPETAKQASAKRPGKTVKYVPASHKTSAIRRK